jgi:hypothetical protein
MIQTFRLFRIATAAIAFCGMTATASAVPVTRTGVIKVVCTIVTDASVAKGSNISLDVSARGSGLNASQTVFTGASVAKSTASQAVTLELPYKWTFTNPQNIVAVYLTVSTGIYPNSATVTTTLSIPTPANGATATITIPVRI